MAKKRKTRKKKQLADLRHHAYQPTADSATHTPKVKQADNKPSSSPYTFSAVSLQTPTRPAQNSAITYSYLGHDLRKTLFVTSAIVLAQVVLLFVIR